MRFKCNAVCHTLEYVRSQLVHASIHYCATLSAALAHVADALRTCIRMRLRGANVRFEYACALVRH